MLRMSCHCLAFVDKFAIICEKEEDAKKQFDNMNEIARSIGRLRIAYNKTKKLNTVGDWATPEDTMQKSDD